MRLLMTTDTVGGVWTYTTELTAELLRREMAVALVTIGLAPTALQLRWLEQTAAAWGDAFCWELCEAPLEWMSNNHRAYLDAESLLLLLAREFGADLLHSNQFCFGALPTSLPRLVVAHSDVLSWAAACRAEALEASPWLEKYCALTTAGLRRADAVVAPTQWMLNALAANFRIPNDAQVIANGRTLPVKPLPTERRLQAVTAGRLWDPAKNLELLVKVRAPLPILVAGDAAGEAPTLLPAGTTMLGLLSEDDLLDVFRQSSIYLCTSCYEPFGLAPLEAALCGCAVLANDIPSLREVWGDGALYFHDSSSLSTLLSRLTRDPQQLAAAQHNSWRRAQRFSAACMADRYLGLYRTMLTKHEIAANVA